ncbi:MAG: hypothetical protein ABI611_03690 [Solirubrobacteraceae bacterium]
MAEPVADIVEETLRLLHAADGQGVGLRLIGGLAVRLHSGDGRLAAFDREFKDVDFAIRLEDSRKADALFIAMGYRADRAFNALNAGNRAIYEDVAHGRHIDVFVDSFEMCHRIPIADRMLIERATIPLAELLLTKLQIVEVNEKDQRDICALLHEHEVGESDDETINAAEVARLCAADWGLWRTCLLNVEKMRDAVGRYDIPESDRDVIRRRLEQLWARIEQEPKSRKWKLRDRIGDRRQWYLEPEEVGP